MEQINLKVKAEVLSGLCGELEKKQTDFENYAESVMKEALKANGNKPVHFRAVRVWNKEDEQNLDIDTLSTDSWGRVGFSESADEHRLYKVGEITNRGVANIVEAVADAVEK